MAAFWSSEYTFLYVYSGRTRDAHIMTPRRLPGKDESPGEDWDFQTWRWIKIEP